MSHSDQNLAIKRVHSGERAIKPQQTQKHISYLCALSNEENAITLAFQTARPISAGKKNGVLLHA